LLVRVPSAYILGSMPARRGAVAAAVAAAIAWPHGPEQGTAFAADAPAPPKNFDISGFEGKRANVNGRWNVADGSIKELNQRAVYKKDGEDLYLMVNDCGEFQIDKKVMGECTGFARQKGKGKWDIDGAVVEGKVKVKPVVVLKKGDKVEATKDFETDDDGKDKLKKGSKGVVEEIDPDGDAGIKFDNVKVQSFVFKENWGNLKKL